MSVKRMSLRFNLDKEEERRAWEHLQAVPGSRNRAVINAINQTLPEDLADVIRSTVRECFREFSAVPAEKPVQIPAISEDELGLLDSLEDFLGG